MHVYVFQIVLQFYNMKMFLTLFRYAIKNSEFSIFQIFQMTVYCLHFNFIKCVVIIWKMDIIKCELNRKIYCMLF
jgi:hypothetical protein